MATKTTKTTRIGTEMRGIGAEMSAKDLQDDYSALHPETAVSVGKLLGQHGEPVDWDLNKMLRQTQKQLSNLPEFAVWMGRSARVGTLRKP